VIDGDFETYYAVGAETLDATIELNLGEIRDVEGGVIHAYFPLGPRVNGCSIECWVNQMWAEVYSGKKIGYKRIILEGHASARNIQFPATDRIRLKIKSSYAEPLISTIQIIGRN